MKTIVRFLGKAAQPLLLLTCAGVLCFAQSSPFGKAAQNVSAEVVSTVKWVGIVIACIAGLSMAAGGSHGSHMGTKITGLVIGLVCALFANPLVTWISTIGS